MDFSTIEFSRAGIGSSLFHDYFQGSIPVAELASVAPSLEHISASVRQAKSYPYQRELLADTLAAQYKSFGSGHPAVTAHIEALRHENTFTVITGHQACVLTGPAYFIYKIVSAISLSKKLNELHPGHTFVPVYWMNSEDHDFEEINHFYLFQKRWEWSKPVPEEMAVGRMPTEGLPELLEACAIEFANIDGLAAVLRSYAELYKNAGNFAEATFRLVDTLFAEHGLVIFNQDEPALKKIFLSNLGKDIWEKVSYREVSAFNALLEKSGYHAQVSPREINFFYHAPTGRKRIIEENGLFRVMDTELSFTRENLKKALVEEPENFSTNVITRPLYQQSVFPNIAYIGGPSEVHYWLQLKTEFEALKIPYPTVLMRDSFLVVRENLVGKIQKSGFEIPDFFQPEEQLGKAFILKNQGEEVNLSAEAKALELLFDQVGERIEMIDKSLLQPLSGEKQKALNGLKNLESKLIRSLKNKEEQQIKTLKDIRQRFFPEGVFQERRDNFLHFTTTPSSFIDLLLAQSDCLIPGVKLVRL